MRCLHRVAETFALFNYSDARGELRTLYYSLPVGSEDGSLLDALRTKLAEMSRITGKGFIPSGVTANGFSATSSVPGLGTATPGSVKAMWSELVDIAEKLTNRSPTPTDAVLYADMMLNLEPVRSYVSDYGSLRYA